MLNRSQHHRWSARRGVAAARSLPQTEWDGTRTGARGRPGLCSCLYAQPMARHRGRLPPRQTRLGTLTAASIVIVLGTSWHHWLGAGRTALGPDEVRWFTSRTRRHVLRKLDAPLRSRPSRRPRDGASRTAAEYGSPRNRCHRLRDPSEAGRRKQYQVQSYGTVVLGQGPHRARRRRSEQDLTTASSRWWRRQEDALLPPGHGERDPNSTERPGYAAIKGALERENYGVERLRSSGGAVPRGDGARGGGPTSDLLPRSWPQSRRTSRRAQAVADDGPASHQRGGRTACIRRLAKDWACSRQGRHRGRERLGQLIGSSYDTPCPVSYPSIPSPAFRHADGVSLAGPSRPRPARAASWRSRLSDRRAQLG